MKLLKASLPVISVFCGALLVRIIYNVIVADDYFPQFDAGLYHILALNLLEKHCYCLYGFRPTVSRPPLWPFLMVGIYFFTGPQAFYARLFYCFLGSGTCVLVYLLTRDLFGRRAALCSGVIAAVYTGLFIYDGWLYTESLYTFCLTMFAYALFRLQQVPSLSTSPSEEKGPVLLRPLQLQMARQRWVITCGILLGLVALTRPNGILLLGLLCLWAVLVIRARILPWQTVVKETLIIACIAVSMLAPWTYRNYRVTHAFVPVSTGLGEVLLGAYNNGILKGDPARIGMWTPPKGASNHDARNYTPANDVADTERALSWMRAHVQVMPYLLGLHLRNMWVPYTYAHGLPFEQYPRRLSSKIMLDMINLMSFPIFFSAAAGLLVTWSHWKNLLVVYLLLAFTIIQNIVFYGDMRFRSPIEPLLVLLAGGALWRLKRFRLDLLQAKRKKRLAVSHQHF